MKLTWPFAIAKVSWPTINFSVSHACIYLYYVSALYTEELGLKGASLYTYFCSGDISMLFRQMFPSAVADFFVS